MKTQNIKIIFIIVWMLILLPGCSNAVEQYKEPAIEYHNDFSTPLDVIKTLQYSVYSKNKVLLVSCYSEKMRKRFEDFYKDDSNFEKGNRDIVYWNLDKLEIKYHKVEGEERATIIYLVNKEKGWQYFLYKDKDRWYIL